MDAEPVESFRIAREWPGGENGMTYYILSIEFTTGGHQFAGEVYYRGDQDYCTLNSWPSPVTEELL